MNNKSDKEKLLNIIYWFLPLFLFISQLIYTLNSMNQIRYEELAESVRNVYWLQNRTIYDGVSSNVGWYGLLLIVYNFFGFSLNNAKFIRLAIHFISILSLTLIFKKYLGVKNAAIPLLTIGLSPIFLYFNTLQTSYGIDLQYLPISLLLLTSFKFNHSFKEYCKHILFWFINVLACMSYPTYIFYLPALASIYVIILFQKTKTQKIKVIIKYSTLSFISFFTPLLIAFLYVKDKTLLFYDPVTKSGIFRGAGSLQLDWKNYVHNLSGLFSDLFVKGFSYNFEIPNPDFSNIYPLFPVFLTFLFSIALLKNKKYRTIVFVSLTTFLFSLIIANLSFDPSTQPGIRRNTVLLASFYVLFSLSYDYIVDKKFKLPFLKDVLIIFFILLPIHHLLSYSVNVANFRNPGIYQYEPWPQLTALPKDSLNIIINSSLQENLPLSCKDEKGRLVLCRYSEIYASVAGSCLWNRLTCKQILGYDLKTKKFIPLSIKLWEDYYWPH